MNRTLGIFRMHWRDKFSVLVLPWVICGFSFVVNLIVGAGVRPEEGIYTGGLSSIYVYVFVAGIVILAQTFPFALGMGVRRTDYFWGTLAATASSSAITTVVLILLSEAEAGWLNGWGVGLHFFHLPFVHEGPAWLQAATHFTLLMTLILIGFFISAVYRRFGKFGLYAFGLVALLVFIVGPLLLTYFERWDDIGRWVEANFHTLNDLTPWLLLVAVLLGLGSYGMLRKATI
ncbi:hypothetical protein [Cohnella caldifontis]|uniref:hypothetical protein n=1 Tax=Cohnella caldifontis TaxID=3027471 RepID=UPI0023EC701B|nr:hypothetical protein [Cohnella sp. YIM B05605]